MRISDWSSDVCSSDLLRKDYQAVCRLVALIEVVSESVSRPLAIRAKLFTREGAYAQRATVTDCYAKIVVAHRKYSPERTWLICTNNRLTKDRKSTRLNSSH